MKMRERTDDPQLEWELEKAEESPTESPEVEEISALRHLRGGKFWTPSPRMLQPGSKGESLFGKHYPGLQDPLCFPHNDCDSSPQPRSPLNRFKN